MSSILPHYLWEVFNYPTGEARQEKLQIKTQPKVSAYGLQRPSLVVYKVHAPRLTKPQGLRTDKWPEGSLQQVRSPESAETKPRNRNLNKRAGCRDSFQCLPHPNDTPAAPGTAPLSPSSSQNPAKSPQVLERISLLPSPPDN